MRLGNPNFVFGLIGTAIPILIYLFTRRRVKQVAFSTLRFFAGASSMLVRRKKTSEAILLLMRVAACGLLAMAFARPFLLKKDGSKEGLLRAAAARVVVADVSGSMVRADLPEQLRRGALAALQDLPGGSAAALVSFDQSATIAAPATLDVEAVRQAAEKLAPGQGATDLAGAIRKADEILARISAPVKEIVCISDLQRSGWENFRGDWNLPPGVKLTVHRLQAGGAEPLTIQGADCPQSVVAESLPRPLTVRVANASAETMADVPVTLSLGGRVVESTRVTVPPQGHAAVRFRHTFTDAGDNAGVITVAGGTSPERQYYFNTRLIPRIHVLILSESSGDAKAGDGVFFLRMALTPSTESPFLAELAKPDAATAAQWQQASVVIVADTTTLSERTRAAIGNVLARGGGVLFLPGSHTQADSFNNVFAETAPAKLRRVLAAASGRSGDAKATVGKIDYEHPVFEIFQRPNYGDFAAVTFDQFWEVGDSQLCRVSARFTDGRPMLLEKSIGGGVSMMMVCPVDLRWSNLPLRAIFLPYMHQIMRHLSIRTESQTALVVGQSLPIGKGFKLRDPAGAVSEGESLVARRAGLYQLVNEQGEGVFCYAVNQAVAEAETATVEPSQVVAALQRDAAETAKPASLGEDDVAESARREMWSYLVAGLVVLSLGELLLANRTAEQ